MDNSGRQKKNEITTSGHDMIIVWELCSHDV